MSPTVVALGDSFSCGEGVGIDIRPEQTWVALLCDALPAAHLVNLSTAGARVRDVRRDQLPCALVAAPQLATVMVGLNDIIRSGLSAEKLTADLRAMVDELAGCGATVLIARWHDPGAVLGVPVRLRRALALRLAQVNEAVDAAVKGGGTPAGRRTILSLDLGRVPELTNPGAWAADGVHPSPAGHRAIARSAGAVLSEAGLSGLLVRGCADLLPMPAGPGTARRTAWLLSRGLPWLAQHSGRVAPAVLSMAVQAIRDRGDSDDRLASATCDRSAAKEIRSLVGKFGGDRTEALPGCGVTGLSQHPRTPEIAWTTG